MAQPLFYTLSGQAAGARVEPALWVETAHYQGDYARLVTLRKRADAGGAVSFRLDPLLLPLLGPWVPVPGPAAAPHSQVAAGLLRNYYVRTTSWATAAGAPPDYQVSGIRAALRGGLSVEWRGLDFFAQAPGLTPWLSWQPTGAGATASGAKAVVPQQPEWLSWLAPAALASQQVRVRRAYRMSPAATPVVDYEPLATPAGGWVLRLLAVPLADTRLGFAQLSVRVETLTGQALSPEAVFAFVERSPRTRFLLFSNSLGGMDTLRCEGRLDVTLEATADTVELPPLAAATGSTLDQLDPDLLCLGATAQVQQHPAGAGILMVLIPDTTGQGLVVARDGYFQLTARGRWVRLDSQAAAVANVPPYAANVVYAVNYLVRYTPPGGFESFYYALKAGKLPAPASTTTANWRLVPGPVPATTLAQFITLGQAQGLDGAGVVPGRRYGVTAPWNNAASPELVYLDGFENYFRRRGTLLRDDGSQLEVDVDVQAGTYQVAASGGGGAGGPQAPLTNGGTLPYVDVFLDQPAATLVGVAGRANFSKLLAQVLDPATNAAYAAESDGLADVQATLTAAWAGSPAPARLVLRCRVVPLSSGLVAHALLTFSQPFCSQPQSFIPHASGFRLFGNAFALQDVAWTHPGASAATNGSSITLVNTSGLSSSTGSPQAANSGAGLRMALEATHNGTYSYDTFGFSAATAPNPLGNNYSVNFYVEQGIRWYARIADTVLAQGSLSGTSYRLRLEVYDDKLVWLVGGVLVYSMPSNLTDPYLWPSCSMYAVGAAFTDCRVGGQVTSPR